MRSSFKECQQVGIGLVFVCGGKAVRCVRVDLQGCILDQLRRAQSRGANRHDLVIVTVNNQRRHIKLLQVLAEIRLGKCLDTVEGVLGTGLHPLEPERVDHALRDLGAGPVGSKERAAGEILVELRAVGDATEADFIELFNRQAAKVDRRF